MSLPPAEVQYQTEHADEDESGHLGAFFIVCIVLSLLFVGMRVASRMVLNVGLKADDYTIIVGMVIAIGSFVTLIIYAYAAGLGKHYITLSADQKVMFAKLNYSYNILNLMSYPVIKISILLLYRRIFTGVWFQRTVLLVLTFVTLMGLSTTFSAVFACVPIHAFWNPMIPSKCIDSNLFYWCSAALNAFTDITILILPLPSTWKLQIPRRQKIGITCIFALGGCTCIVSIIRIVFYLRFDANDPSYSFIGDAYSTPGEICLAIICACLSTVRPLARSARSRFSSLRSKYATGSSGKSTENNSVGLVSLSGAGKAGGGWPYQPMEGDGHQDSGVSARDTDPDSFRGTNQVLAYSENVSLPIQGNRDLEYGLPGRGINVRQEIDIARE